MFILKENLLKDEKSCELINSVQDQFIFESDNLKSIEEKIKNRIEINERFKRINNESFKIIEYVIYNKGDETNPIKSYKITHLKNQKLLNKLEKIIKEYKKHQIVTATDNFINFFNNDFEIESWKNTILDAEEIINININGFKKNNVNIINLFDFNFNEDKNIINIVFRFERLFKNLLRKNNTFGTPEENAKNEINYIFETANDAYVAFNLVPKGENNIKEYELKNNILSISYKKSVDII